MDAPERGALMLVRFTAATLVGVSAIEFTLAWLESSAHHAPLKISDLILQTILLLLGVAIFIKARPVARWISDKLDL